MKKVKKPSFTSYSNVATSAKIIIGLKQSDDDANSLFACYCILLYVHVNILVYFLAEFSVIIFNILYRRNVI